VSVIIVIDIEQVPGYPKFKEIGLILEKNIAVVGPNLK